MHAASKGSKPFTTAGQLVAIFQFLESFYTNLSPEKGTALQKGKALEKGTTKDSWEEMADAPDWGDDDTPEVNQEPGAAAPSKSPVVAPRKSPTPARKSPTPARKSPTPPRKNPPQDKSWGSKDAWEDDGWEKGWNDGWDDWSQTARSHDDEWGWEDDGWKGDGWSYGKTTWKEDGWGSHHYSQSSGSSKERRTMEVLKTQCPTTEHHVLRLAAMGGSRFKRLQKRAAEQQEKKEQAEKMKLLENQVSQLNECNMQWMHYYQQQAQASWQAAAAWQWEAHAQQAAGQMEGITLCFLICTGACFGIMLCKVFITFVLQLSCFVLPAGQPGANTRAHEEPGQSSSAMGSADAGTGAKGLSFVVTAVFLVGRKIVSPPGFFNLFCGRYEER